MEIKNASKFGPDGKSCFLDAEGNFSYPNFEDITVSTKTFIVMTNATIDINKMYEQISLSDYVVLPKKRGRKKKLPMIDPNKDLISGAIICLKLGKNMRGTDLKKRKGESRSFRNCLSIVMLIAGKKIDFKISKNGMFQMTGCKSDSHAEECILHVWRYMQSAPESFSLRKLGPVVAPVSDVKNVRPSDETKTVPQGATHDLTFEALFIPGMRNIDFSLGFTLDREKIHRFFNREKDYISLLELSVGYTGVNIKTQVRKDIRSLPIKRVEYSTTGEVLRETWVSYQTYLDRIPAKDARKKIDKQRHNTFLVFHSGKVIMSSMCKEFAEEAYANFMENIRNNYKKFQEVLTV